jgi:hypothetical protein
MTAPFIVIGEIAHCLFNSYYHIKSLFGMFVAKINPITAIFMFRASGKREQPACLKTCLPAEK